MEAGAYSKRRQFKFAEIIPWCQKINPFYSCLLDGRGKLRAKNQSLLEYLTRRKYFLVFVLLEHFRWSQIFPLCFPRAKTQNRWAIQRTNNNFDWKCSFKQEAQMKISWCLYCWEIICYSALFVRPAESKNFPKVNPPRFILFFWISFHIVL